jgi:mannose-6-phosphate isomerase
VELLTGGIRYYDWGSHELIARLQRRPTPTSRPEAELWIGAHPGNPSTVVRDGRAASVADVIAADPVALLGPDVPEPRLPFLLKLLAVQQPLSLQAHPDRDQARAGYARENAAGLAADSPLRHYVDPYHKPELLVALEPFDALCGFRDPEQSADEIAALAIPELDPVAKTLRTGTVAERLRTAVRALMDWEPAQLADVISRTTRAATGERRDVLAALRRAYPTDAGVLVSLLLNHVTLQAGQAIWMPAGNLHAYLGGLGVEIMAASDNVLRGGFTSKHVNVAELLDVVRYEVLADPVVPAVEVSAGIVRWPVPVPDFGLRRIQLAAESRQLSVAVVGPRVVLCTAGEVTVDDGTAPVVLQPGQAAIGPAQAPVLLFSGVGEAFLATAGG